MPDFSRGDNAGDNEEYDRSIEGDDKSWVPDDALASLVSERAINPDESEEQLTRRLFKENSASAALQIIHVSHHGTNERTRLDASKYIVERVLGKIGDDKFEGEKNPLEALMEGVLEQAEAFANSPYNHPAIETPDDGKGILDENK